MCFHNQWYRCDCSPALSYAGLSQKGLKELWVRAGVGDTTRYIPLHTLYEWQGSELCKVLPALHSLTGCDTTSRVGTKKAALKTNPEKILGQFGLLPNLPQTIIKKAEEYLVKVLRPGSEAKNFLVCGQRFSTTPRVVLNKSSPKPAKDSFQNQTEVL